MEPITTFNPATGERIASFDPHTPDQCRQAVQTCRDAFLTWRDTPLAARADCLRRAAWLLRDNATAYARLMTKEMGKPIRAGQAEAEKCAWVCEYYAEQAARFLQEEVVPTDARRSYVCFEPLGAILAVMPWNFPFWQVMRFAAPALMAGNTFLLKHASNVPECALAIERLFAEAGVTQEAVQTLIIPSRQVELVLADPLIRAVTLTGSVPAGRAVAQQAGSLLKKCVLELGGSDPYVILDDSDLDQAVEVCVTSRLINSGQSCIAAKRFIVTPQIREPFEKRFVERMKRARVGDPLAETTDVGPMARVELRDELHGQVLASIQRGARCLLGGTVPAGPGAFYPPTVLTDVAPGMPAYEEELFGPVAAILPARDEADAIRLANDSVFGLGAAVFTKNAARGEQIAARHLEAGCCFVNDFVKSDPRLPFGGVKESGFGRELSHYGIKEFVNIKTVYVK